MTTANDHSGDEAQIRKLIDAWTDALRKKDVDALMADRAEDILSFDVVDPLQYDGAAASRQRAEEWFASFRGPIGLEVRNLEIAASGDVAFSHSLHRVSGTTADGGTIDMWLRSTVCYRKVDGRWLVTHQHSSVPFDPATGEASLGLQP